MLSNLFKKNNIFSVVSFAFVALLYVIYTSLSDIYPLLPPLMGVMFLIFHRHYNDKNHYVSILVLLCLFFYEFDKTLVFGIIPVVFFIVHLFVANNLESLITANMFFIIIYTFALYLFYVAGMILCNILFKTPILEFSFIYLYYAILDCFLALIFYLLFMRD